MTDERDIRKILEAWPVGDRNVRACTLADGRTVIQARLPFGIEQYERDGRPDGVRPHGYESLLEYHLARLQDAARRGEEESFRLGREECAALFDEGTAYYYRYLRLFELQEWERTIRDTGRNMRLFDLVNRHAENEEDRTHLEQWRPYIVRMHAAASAMLALQQGQHQRALRLVEDAIARIEALPEMDLPVFRGEHERSLAALRELARQIVRTRPMTESERLERELGSAVEREDFEQAARLRDRLRVLRRTETAAHGTGR